MSASEPTSAPARGAIVRDTATDRIGRVMDRSQDGTILWLRPADGGVEWPADTDRVEPVRHRQAADDER